ncbi:hypothetical protein Sjap_021794 [Stephania japonica]|uniref:Wall-associated receptor kinase galacturonan-binding domain-containing protein n=1 Tax=Stephania japonica TaxID=461633 RepID=A0AAP0HT55_9MAGN
MLWITLLSNLFVAWFLAAADATTLPLPITKKGCQDKCGNVSIPYPFGVGDDPICYEEAKFKLVCNTTFDPPLLFMEGDNSVPIIDISLSQGQLTLLLWISRQCHTINGTVTDDRFYLTLNLTDGYKVSNTRNKFIAIGCDTRAILRDTSGKSYQTGCISYCTDVNSIIDGSCTGIGCCETAIPKGVNAINILFGSYYNHSYSWNFSRCSYAFLADIQWFKFNVSDLLHFPQRVVYKHMGLPAPPVVVDWGIGNLNCTEARQYVCGQNTYCSDSENAPGYHCLCNQGFEGNPYLPDGCQGTSFGVLLVLIGSSVLFSALQKRKLMKSREKFFQQNGGMFLRQQLSSHDHSVETVKIFTSEELKRATDNYNEHRILGQGGYGTVYKGILSDNRVVPSRNQR